MSDTDTPITPSPHIPIRNDQGITVWRPVLTTLSVHGVPTDHKARHVVVREDGVERFRFRLSGEDAQHIAARLVAPLAPSAQPEQAA